jgi:hypothetical protein
MVGNPETMFATHGFRSENIGHSVVWLSSLKLTRCNVESSECRKGLPAPLNRFHLHASPIAEIHFRLHAERQVGVEFTPFSSMKGIRWQRCVEICIPMDSQ